MFFDDVKKGGAASAILSSNKDGTLANKPAEVPNNDHEILIHELHNSIHSRDVEGTHQALKALHGHYSALAANEPEG